MLKMFASAGNRTRAARVAGEHSTTEPPMHTPGLLNFPCFMGSASESGQLFATKLAMATR